MAQILQKPARCWLFLRILQHKYLILLSNPILDWLNILMVWSGKAVKSSPLPGRYVLPVLTSSGKLSTNEAQLLKSKAS